MKNTKGGKMATKGYCVKCKSQVEMKNPVESTTSKGTKIAKGKCPNCGTTVCRMGGIQKQRQSQKDIFQFRLNIKSKTQPQQAAG